MTTYRDVVLEHFRHPRNRRTLPAADVSIEGANPLCGDRVRVDLRIVGGQIAEIGFTADACILCVAAASLLTEHVHGMSIAEAGALADDVALQLVGGTVPAPRRKCATLPVDTVRRGIARFIESAR